MRFGINTILIYRITEPDQLSTEQRDAFGRQSPARASLDTSECNIVTLFHRRASLRLLLGYLSSGEFTAKHQGLGCIRIDRKAEVCVRARSANKVVIGLEDRQAPNVSGGCQIRSSSMPKPLGPIDLLTHVGSEHSDRAHYNMQSHTSTNLAADLFHVRGVVAVITGGGSGLGLYAARALDANGARAVYIIGRRESILAAAVRLLLMER
nr:hypothetical protein CFP56_28465 [Quercus suber]